MNTILMITILLGAAAAAAADTLSYAAASLPSGTQVAVLELEKGGRIELELFADTPITAGNFARLVEEGFYDGLTFHRVVDDFVAQGGDPLGKGYGEPGYFLPVETDGDHKAIRGMVSMARKGSSIPNQYGRTSGSQFFIMLGDAPRLDDNFCFFARVVSGMELVDKIEQGDKIKTASITPSKGE